MNFDNDSLGTSESEGETLGSMDSVTDESDIEVMEYGQRLGSSVPDDLLSDSNWMLINEIKWNGYHSIKTEIDMKAYTDCSTKTYKIVRVLFRQLTEKATEYTVYSNEYKSHLEIQESWNAYVEQYARYYKRDRPDILKCFIVNN